MFGASTLPVQDGVGAVFFIAALPAGLVVVPLALMPTIATGNVSLFDGIPFLPEFKMTLAVLLNALLIDRLVRRRQLRRTGASTCLPNH